MPFSVEKTHDGDFEVLMHADTLHKRWNRGTKNRRFALCTHENDAEVIMDALNNCEKLGILK